ncbi:Glu-tRNA(Gln) amidotransferase subunit GatE [Thermosphaera aggregans]|jgi:glutamyl-tRNA(Gln) amidotransferase subunit E|uniref:Glutamyl-tRNA(Gln) amidotransferase subunit E n=1 Tax=Thermosphaera aggregans (strain DSM 11486 / M11TL) TaxID=633148 RepID=D5TZZ0_THEAM|nr:Glu-tRNA(Gln) amidotransferase subunit GatE [Thermosphaera aggregans]ADG90440.1 glutamyl-tRNA(Gln) amidotransferase subunit E [Thermosphaera aggregans DSM 11486]
MSKLDFKELGLRVGLEIHVQLDTSRKLFCKCPTKLVEERSKFNIERGLRPAKSETGEVDPAAMLEWRRERVFIYEAPPESSCLVEIDEEPPHQLDEDSLTVAIAIAKALNMRVVDEIHVMRKIVVDGSNVSGFQRTALIALNGFIMEGEKKIGIQTLCLEEDAARKISEEGNKVFYRVDRLGIPLVEIATAPDINDPEEAMRVALKLGQLVRLTGYAKRGLGTIRQDLNVSIRDGAKVEIKGVQHLYLIPKVVELEALRQQRLLEIRNELLRRNVKPEDLKEEIVDVTEVFENTSSKIIRKSIATPGNGVFAVVLKKFKGLLGKEVQPGRRFGTELADYARVWGGVGGIFHTDELPNYGITAEEVRNLYEKLGANPGEDAIVIVADQREKCVKALKAVVDRARQAVIGVPEETRSANPDGTSKYTRPRPGAARMYPETDIPLVYVTPDLVEKAMKIVPEPPDAKLKRFVEEHKLSVELATTLIRDLRLDLYEKLTAKYGGSVQPSIIASILVNIIPSLRKENVPIENVTDELIEEIVDMLSRGEISKEAIPDLMKQALLNPEKKLKELVKELGITRLDVNELDRIIEEVVERHREKLLARKEKAFAIAMSETMKIVRGRIDGAIVAENVKKKLREKLNIGSDDEYSRQ